MDKKYAFETARRIGWLAQTPPDFQDGVLARCDLLALQRDQSVYGEGDDATGIFFLAEGTIGFHMHATEGAPTLGHIAGPGFWAGDLSASTGQARKLAILTRSPAWLLRLSRQSLNTLSLNNEDLFWRHMASLLAHSYSITLDILSALRRDEPVARVAATLVNLAAGFPDRPTHVPITQSDLGAITRLSRASVNAAVAELERRRLIGASYGAIEILDMRSLRETSYGN